MGCNQVREKTALIRIVRLPDGTIELDATGKKSGRGAYVCPTKECLAKVEKSGRLGRCLDQTIPNEVYAALYEQLAQVSEVKRDDG